MKRVFVYLFQSEAIKFLYRNLPDGFIFPKYSLRKLFSKEKIYAYFLFKNIVFKMRNRAYYSREFRENAVLDNINCCNFNHQIF